jgi:hypothetical protein
MHGDVSCEWRHFLRYPKYIDKINILVPKEAIIHQTSNIQRTLVQGKYHVPFEFHFLDFNELNIISFLEKRHVTVVYDDCFDRQSKTILWEEIARQLTFRETKHNITTTYLCHEAGNYYPQTARGQQWEAVEGFADYFVLFRKRKIRALLLTQLENEIYDRIRKKCMWRMYRRCYPSNRSHAKAIRKYILRMRIDNYHLFFGDLYNPMRSNEATKEIGSEWYMIPRDLLNLNPPHNPSIHDQNPFEIVIKKQNGKDRYCVVNKTTKSIVKWLPETQGILIES